MLHDLTKLETRSVCLTEITYDWCSTICENRQILVDWEGLLLVSLEIGFCHLDPQGPEIAATLTRTEHHLAMVDVVLKSRKSEAIADLLHAWTIADYFLTPAHTSLGTCTERLVGLHNPVPFSSRLRRLVIRSVGLIGYNGFEEAGVERFIGLLDHLRVTVKDIENRFGWGKLLLDTLKSSEGAQHLSHWCWKLLVELVVSVSRWLEDNEIVCSPRITTFLTEAQEWSKLECWVGNFWMLWPLEAGRITEEDLDRSMLLLFRQRPGAPQKLEQWMERWSQKCDKEIPGSFQRICKRAQEAAQRDTL